MPQEMQGFCLVSSERSVANSSGWMIVNIHCVLSSPNSIYCFMKSVANSVQTLRCSLHVYYTTIPNRWCLFNVTHTHRKVFEKPREWEHPEKHINLFLWKLRSQANKRPLRTSITNKNLKCFELCGFNSTKYRSDIFALKLWK